jgi:hypothetical protein
LVKVAQFFKEKFRRKKREEVVVCMLSSTANLQNKLKKKKTRRHQGFSLANAFWNSNSEKQKKLDLIVFVYYLNTIIFVL